MAKPAGAFFPSRVKMSPSTPNVYVGESPLLHVLLTFLVVPSCPWSKASSFESAELAIVDTGSARIQAGRVRAATIWRGVPSRPRPRTIRT